MREATTRKQRFMMVNAYISKLHSPHVQLYDVYNLRLHFLLSCRVEDAIRLQLFGLTKEFVVSVPTYIRVSPSAYDRHKEM